MGVQPNTGQMHEKNQQDHGDDSEQHVPTPRCNLSTRRRQPRPGHLVLLAQPVGVMPQGLYTESAVVMSNTNKAAQASPTS